VIALLVILALLHSKGFPQPHGTMCGSGKEKKRIWDGVGHGQRAVRGASQAHTGRPVSTFSGMTLSPPPPPHRGGRRIQHSRAGKGCICSLWLEGGREGFLPSPGLVLCRPWTLVCMQCMHALRHGEASTELEVMVEKTTNGLCAPIELRLCMRGGASDSRVATPCRRAPAPCSFQKRSLALRWSRIRVCGAGVAQAKNPNGVQLLDEIVLRARMPCKLHEWMLEGPKDH
jgi:hypothetical protein